MTAPAATWVLIPIKARGQGKSRLAGALSDDEREVLVDAMLRHVVDTVGNAGSIARVLLVGPSRHDLDTAIPLLREPGRGLNAALGSAVAEIGAMDGRPNRLIVLAADLPCLTALDVDVLAQAPAGAIAIAPDRHGIGTNALSLPLPEAVGFRFHYGIDSATWHRREAQRLGLTAETILREGLEKDIDEPSDLVDAGQVHSIAS